MRAFNVIQIRGVSQTSWGSSGPGSDLGSDSEFGFR